MILENLSVLDLALSGVKPFNGFALLQKIALLTVGANYSNSSFANP